MKETMMQLLSELMKDSRKSDRQLAKALQVSQPTITRTRRKLIEEGIIREFTAIPDFEKIGYQIMAITIAKAKPILTPAEQEKAKRFVVNNPQVILVASAESSRGNGVMISLHRSFEEYRDFLNVLRQETGNFMENFDTTLVSLTSSMMVKPLSLAGIARPHTTKQI